MTTHSMLLCNPIAASTLASFADSDSSRLVLLFELANLDENELRPGKLLRQVKTCLQEEHCALASLWKAVQTLLTARRLRERVVAVVSNRFDGVTPLINYDVTSSQVPTFLLPAIHSLPLARFGLTSCAPGLSINDARHV